MDLTGAGRGGDTKEIEESLPIIYFSFIPQMNYVFVKCHIVQRKCDRHQALWTKAKPVNILVI